MVSIEKKAKVFLHACVIMAVNAAILTLTRFRHLLHNILE